MKNNLDREIAQFPYHLITYGGNGSVFQNWAQYHVTMKYLCEMEDDCTLVLYSGHPLGVYPSSVQAPRMVVSNGMVIPNYSSRDDYDKLYAMGNSQYGQMTAGSFCYIGPQGIVHGTTLTVLNAARKYIGVSEPKGSGIVYISSGLGGMSGAQPKAATIAGMISVTAEVDRNALEKRHAQGWVHEITESVQDCITRLRDAKENLRVVSIGFLGNIVDLWEALADLAEKEGKCIVELGSDQTSLHNPYNGGYYPVQLSFEESRSLMASDPSKFKNYVQTSLQRHVRAVNRLTKLGMHFWDYGNSFLLEAGRANAEIFKLNSTEFRYPSYVQDIMGDIFSLGFGPFRWVCTSATEDDLIVSDKIAADVLKQYILESPPLIEAQLQDNLRWIEAAHENKMVVGSQARILYADRHARQQIAIEFNNAIRDGRLKCPIVLSRDHHDVSGTDSPFRETSNITDGSKFCADMAIHNVIGDSFRGATWVAIHNGGGVGWGEVMNGGFGLVLDGSTLAEENAKSMLNWDVNNGVSRRAWARYYICIFIFGNILIVYVRNDNAIFSIQREMDLNPKLKVTLPTRTDSETIKALIVKAAGQ